jgi:putative MFS transporter
MMIGAGLSGYLGDRFGRRFSYQANLAIFGLASLAASFAPDIYWLILLRFIGRGPWRRTCGGRRYVM